MSTSLAGLKDNPVTRDLIVDDEDYADGAVFQSALENAANAVANYAATMRNVADNSSGAAADNLRAYADRTDQMLQSVLEGIGNRLEANLTRYLSEIDAADSKLY